MGVKGAVSPSLRLIRNRLLSGCQGEGGRRGRGLGFPRIDNCKKLLPPPCLQSRLSGGVGTREPALARGSGVETGATALIAGAPNLTVAGSTTKSGDKRLLVFLPRSKGLPVPSIAGMCQEARERQVWTRWLAGVLPRQ